MKKYFQKNLDRFSLTAFGGNFLIDNNGIWVTIKTTNSTGKHYPKCSSNIS